MHNTSGITRNILADISNLQSQPNLTIQNMIPQQQNNNNSKVTTKEYIDKLQKENAALMKIVADRNKIIELSAVELQKLRINLQKVQHQNVQLAQSNSLMLAELNAGKDKLKTLHHELGCQNSLLKSMNFLQQDKVHAACLVPVNEVESTKLDEVGESLPGEAVGDKACKTNKIRKSRQSQSLGPSTAKPVQTKEIVDNKRRRQSARFKPQEPEQAENLFEIDNTKFSIPPLNEEVRQENDPNLLATSVKIECEKPDDVSEGSGRTSLGRPLRRAAEKVQSYKEVPLNVKMRRA
ncbi:hypothetical protein ACFE04_003623 [Oxalis oulophora]